MQVNTLQEEEFYTIALDGDLDASSSIIFDKAIENAVVNNQKKLLIDCGRLNYISSAGLGVFMSYLQEFEEKKIKMVVYGLKEKVFNVFQILGLDQLIDISETEETAKKILQK